MSEGGRGTGSLGEAAAGRSERHPVNLGGWHPALFWKVSALRHQAPTGDPHGPSARLFSSPQALVTPSRPTVKRPFKESPPCCESLRNREQQVRGLQAKAKAVEKKSPPLHAWSKEGREGQESVKPREGKEQGMQKQATPGTWILSQEQQGAVPASVGVPHSLPAWATCLLLATSHTPSRH